MKAKTKREQILCLEAYNDGFNAAASQARFKQQSDARSELERQRHSMEVATKFVSVVGQTVDICQRLLVETAQQLQKLSAKSNEPNRT